MRTSLGLLEVNLSTEYEIYLLVTKYVLVTKYIP